MAEFPREERESKRDCRRKNQMEKAFEKDGVEFSFINKKKKSVFVLRLIYFIKKMKNEKEKVKVGTTRDVTGRNRLSDATWRNDLMRHATAAEGLRIGDWVEG